MKQLDVPQTLPALSEAQSAQLHTLQELALSFNTKLNLYSNASAEHFWQCHVLHSLALAVRPFPSGARVVDWGTGGGLPGLPLAILFPEVEFVLIDSVGKKIQAVQAIARRLGLDNVITWHGRAEQWEEDATHSVSRATAPLTTLWGWHERVAQPIEAREDVWPSGLFCLKGGDLEAEIGALTAEAPGVTVTHRSLAAILPYPYFQTKALVAVTS